MTTQSQSPAQSAALWRDAATRMLGRAEATASALKSGFPHWANARTGEWTTTPDGDWTGGAFPGILWLGYRMTGEQRLRDLAHAWCMKLKPRARLETAFKGFGFYCGAALGDMVAQDAEAATLALEAAASLRNQFDPRLGLIPLGKDAEEHGEVGKAFSSIDSLQAVPLLFWAARKTGDATYVDVASRHTTRVLDIHCHPDGSIIQSSELDAQSGAVTRHFTHKGYSDTSIWGRAQAWGMIYSAMAFARRPQETRWLQQSMAAADWWLKHVPPGMVAFWDFNDPAIPNAPSDTAATSIVCTALLKLSVLAPAAERARYRDAAERTAQALVSHFVTPTGANESRPAGMLAGGCFNKRPDSRASDAATNAELIFGSYFLFESLQILMNTVGATDI
jgi:unsaturated chondroitin disaccharide hydrolase